MESNREEKAVLMGTGIEAKEGGYRSKLKSLGSFGRRDIFLRADKIDLTSLDIQPAKQLNKTWRKINADLPVNEWEIDLSKLELRYELARGTYGIVYKGFYDGREVAVKLMDWGEDGFSREAETVTLRESFHKEVAVWHKLDHANVTKFIGASMGTNKLKIPQKNPGNKPLPARSCCVVVEYLPGGTLKQFLMRNSRKKLAYSTVIKLALDLSKGLSYLHSHKIVHRDVKTENMLLDRNLNLKIADFGVARVEAQNSKDMTGETGTLRYMAPEVLDGKPYNRKCDVYSFSICLWELYCCDVPYWELSSSEIPFAVARQNMRPEIPRCCPAVLASVMRRCWDPRPEERPEMEEVVGILAAVNRRKGGGMIPEGQVSHCFCFISSGRRS